jgi:hypothetical protein
LAIRFSTSGWSVTDSASSSTSASSTSSSRFTALLVLVVLLLLSLLYWDRVATEKLSAPNIKATTNIPAFLQRPTIQTIH